VRRCLLYTVFAAVSLVGGHVAVYGQDGAAIFRDRSCATCHLPAGERPVGAQNRSLAESTGTYGVDRFREIVRAGRPSLGMPAFPASIVSDRDVEIVYDYLRSQTAMTAPPEPDPVSPPAQEPAPPPPPPPQPQPPVSTPPAAADNSRSIPPDVVSYCRDFVDRLDISESIKSRFGIVHGCGVYHARCASCHGQNLLGSSILVPGRPQAPSSQTLDLGRGRGGQVPLRTPNLIAPWGDSVASGSRFHDVHRNLQLQRHYFFEPRAGSRSYDNRIVWSYSRFAEVPGEALYSHFCRSCHEQNRPLSARKLTDGNAPSNFDVFSSKISCVIASSHPCCEGPTRGGEGSETCRAPLDLLSAGLGNHTTDGRFLETRENAHLRRIHNYLCREGAETCEAVEAKRRRELIGRAIGPQVYAEVWQRQREQAEIPNHTYYRALKFGTCVSHEKAQQDGLRELGRLIEKTCRAGNLRTGKVTRSTLAEAVDPRDRPADRHLASSSPGRGVIGEPGEDSYAPPGRGVIGEPGEGATGDSLNVNSGVKVIEVDRSVCVVPELFERGPAIEWLCGENLFGKTGIVTCPPEASFVRVARTSEAMWFQCFTGPWDRFLSNLRQREQSRR